MSDTVTRYPLPYRAEPDRDDSLQVSLSCKAGYALENMVVTSVNYYNGAVTDGTPPFIHYYRGYAFSTSMTSLLEIIEDALPRKATNIDVLARFDYRGGAVSQHVTNGQARLVLGKATTLPERGSHYESTSLGTTVQYLDVDFTIKDGIRADEIPLTLNAENKASALSSIQARFGSSYIWFAIINKSQDSTAPNIIPRTIRLTITYSLPEPHGVPISTKADGAWHEGGILVKANGEWVDVPEAFVKLNGEWKAIGTVEE